MATRLTDVIDISTLQNLQNGFSEATGMAAVITDADGTPVTNGSNITELCSNLIKRSRLGQSKCSGDHVENAKKAQRKGSASVYVCSSGLTEFAAPITSNGELIGAFIGGQVLTESPDESKMRSVATDFGIDPDEYIRALRKVKIYPREKVTVYIWPDLQTDLASVMLSMLKPLLKLIKNYVMRDMRMRNR